MGDRGSQTHRRAYDDMIPEIEAVSMNDLSEEVEVNCFPLGI